MRRAVTKPLIEWPVPDYFFHPMVTARRF